MNFLARSWSRRVLVVCGVSVWPGSGKAVLKGKGSGGKRIGLIDFHREVGGNLWCANEGFEKSIPASLAGSLDVGASR